ncbi:MAG: DUF4388 domain-containing protein [Pseudomonadota bacterium]
MEERNRSDHDSGEEDQGDLSMALKFISGKFVGGIYNIPQDGELFIGRGSDSEITIPEEMVSRKHAKLIVEDRGSVYIQDLNSTNGTFINGERIKKKKLGEGDRILIGTSVMKLVTIKEESRERQQTIADSFRSPKLATDRSAVVADPAKVTRFGGSTKPPAPPEDDEEAAARETPLDFDLDMDGRLDEEGLTADAAVAAALNGMDETPDEAPDTIPYEAPASPPADAHPTYPMNEALKSTGIIDEPDNSPTGSVRITTVASVMEGILGEIPLTDVIQMCSATKKSGVMNLEWGGKTANIFIKDGAIIYASYHKLYDMPGRKAFFRLLGLETGKFTLHPYSDPPEFAELINKPTEYLIMEGLRRIDELHHIEKERGLQNATLKFNFPLLHPLKKLKHDDLDIFQMLFQPLPYEMILDMSPHEDLDTAQILTNLLDLKYIAKA